ncbi:MAG TPA: lytic transglycosylase domain-containing protein [Candidatus Coprocola pullicola]|nr:lytic transglycosylase domain-containing protein [Candidatus Coprocola pullicola]
MLEINPFDLSAISKNNNPLHTTNFNSASFSDALQTVSTTQSLDTIFQKAAKQYDVPVSLLKAIGKAESNFNPEAVSSAGAQGVMQLMPATAQSLGVTNPFDAEQNIMGGAKYIKQMLDRYDGDVKLALAAYNAGSGNVAKYGGIPPFAETQNYVKKVMAYAGEDLTAGTYVSSGISATGTVYQNQLAQSILNFEDFTENDYLLFIESLKNDMSSSLLSVINDTSDEEDNSQNNLFEMSSFLQNYSALLQQQSSDFTVSGLSSSTANLLGNRFQSFYDTEK